jgi:GNAT superfamily N-acetyltransferase
MSAIPKVREAPIARAADEADIPRIVEMGRQFWMQLGTGIDYDPESAAKWAAYMHAYGVLVVATDGGEIVGAAGGLVAPVFCNEAYTTGQELFWWVEPAHRNAGVGMALLNELEAGAKARGVTRWDMVLMENIEPHKAEAMYLRAGYTQTQRVFTKEL